MDPRVGTGRMAPPVCLIVPPSTFLLDERVFVSLGVLRVAAVIEQAGATVELVDLSGIENYLDAIEDHASASAARVFGITSTTPQLPAARAIIERVRAVRPDARVILGGPHVTLVNAARKREFTPRHCWSRPQSVRRRHAAVRRGCRRRWGDRRIRCI